MNKRQHVRYSPLCSNPASDILLVIDSKQITPVLHASVSTPLNWILY